MTYAWFVIFQRCASHRTMHMSYRCKTYTWNDVILVKRSMIRVFFIMSHSSCLVTWYACGQLKFNYRIVNDTWPDTRTMVLRNSRSIQKHRSQIKVQLSYRELHVTGHAHSGIAELEKYPEASNWMQVIVLRYAWGRTRIRVKEPCNEILSFVGHIWRHIV